MKPLDRWSLDAEQIAAFDARVIPLVTELRVKGLRG
jgi:hypothetical protein